MGIVDETARVAGLLSEAIRLGVRSFTPLDTNPIPSSWNHITKIDPEEEKKLPLLYPLYLSHTSAVSVGGSRDVDGKNTEETFILLERADVPTFHEPSAARHVTDRTREFAEFLAIPEVLNGDSQALVGTLGEGVEYLREDLIPETLSRKVGWLPVSTRRQLADFTTSWLLKQAVFEAYIIQNPDSAAAREANVTENDVLNPHEAAFRALAAEKHLESEVVYVEYSGTFGGNEAIELLEKVNTTVSWPRIWYGGGLDSRERTESILNAGADAVVVGNVFHEISKEEVELCERAKTELDTDASDAMVREWIINNTDPKNSSSRRYLATVPSVADPTETATDYMVGTVKTMLDLESLAMSATSTIDDPQGLHQFIGDFDVGSLPGTQYLKGCVSARGSKLPREYAINFLGGKLEIEAEQSSFDHLGLLSRK